jgi:hypothetical protein
LPPAIQNALATARQAIRPIDPKTLAVKLGETLALWPQPENWRSVSKFYFEALETMPGDVVDLALEHVRKHCKFFPRPAELHAPAEIEMQKRHEALARAKRDAEIYRFTREDREKITPEERARNLALLEEAKNYLKDPK